MANFTKQTWKTSSVCNFTCANMFLNVFKPSGDMVSLQHCHSSQSLSLTTLGPWEDGTRNNACKLCLTFILPGALAELRACQRPHTSDSHTDRQTILQFEWPVPKVDKIHSNERKDFHLITFHSVDISLFVRAYPVSARTAAQCLTFLLAELWPSPTKFAGLVFSFFFPPTSVLGNSHFASWAEGSTLVQSHIVILKQLCHLLYVILGCRLGLVCIQVKPKLCSSCAPAVLQVLMAA